MAAMRERLGAFEVPLDNGYALGDADTADSVLYAFRLLSANDKLVLHGECTLAGTSSEWLVNIDELGGDRVVLRSSSTIRLGEGPFRLVIYPWFLYERLLRVLEELPDSGDHFVRSALMAFGKLPPSVYSDVPELSHAALNSSQKQAVALCSRSSLAFVWGPPGTGKTTTLAHIVAELHARGLRTLLTSTTNAAVDQALEKLGELPSLAQAMEDNRVVRIGQTTKPQATALKAVVTRLSKELQETLDKLKNARDDARLRQNKCAGMLAKLEDEAAEKQLYLFESVSPPQVTPAELADLFATSRAHQLSLLPGQELRAVIERRRARLARLEQLASTRIRSCVRELREAEGVAVRRAQIVLATMTNAYINRLLSPERYDVVIVEEAGMAILPSLFYCATLASERVILIGDPRQLPPIMTSNEPYVKKAMGRNIFEVTVPEPRLSDHVVMLDTQYRMHPVIGDLVSALAYDGRLLHAPVTEERDVISDRAPFRRTPLVVVDTEGRAVCAVETGSRSRYNEETADACCVLVCEALADGTDSIAVITPYVAQARTIRRRLRAAHADEAKVECSTVHRFQGNERDIVILDTVDTAPLRPGILLAGGGARGSALNLLNVSISRARGKLVVLADVSYFLEQAPEAPISRLLRMASERGMVVALKSLVG